MSSLVQEAATTGTTITLPGAPTPGNLLLVAVVRADTGDNGSLFTPSPGSGWSQIGRSLNTFYQAHPSFGGRGRLYARVAQAGDTAGPWTVAGASCSLVMAEIAPSNGTTEQTAANAYRTSQQSASVALSCGNTGPALVVGGVATRLNGGTVTPGSGVNVVPTSGIPPASNVGHDRAAILWRDSPGGAVALSATQAGATTDGYCWGMQIGVWGLPPGGTFAGEPGGGVW